MKNSPQSVTFKDKWPLKVNENKRSYLEKWLILADVGKVSQEYCSAIKSECAQKKKKNPNDTYTGVN